MNPAFYFTRSPGDLIEARIGPRGQRVMIVASAFWDAAAGRFPLPTRRPKWASAVSSLALDSGGFTAASRWGKYPWTPAEYAAWAREWRKYFSVDFVACMDYACEPSVDRSTYATNRQRIKATIRNECACREADPDLPWLPVLQGDNLTERTLDLRLRERLGMLPAKYAGIGSVCGRGIRATRRTIKFYADHLPGVRFHAFGMHVRVLDDVGTRGYVHSWDSAAWSWGRGTTDLNRPDELYRRAGETETDETLRMSEYYWHNVVKPRVEAAVQLPLKLVEEGCA